MSKTIGIIGLGSIGLRHALNLQDLGYKVLAHDPRIAHLESVEMVSAYEAQRNADAIIIATPTKEHLWSLDLAQEYKKPIFMEKPLGHALPQHGLEHVAMVGYNQRFNSAVKQAKEWLDAGLIGYPHWATFCAAQYNNKPDYLRDGVVLNWSHEIDLALYLLGPAKVHAAAVVGGEHDHMADILLAHERAVVSHIHLDYLTNPEYRGFTIGGAGGWITVNLPERTAELRTSKVFNAHFRDDDGSYGQDYKDEMQAFIDRIDGKKTIGCTGEEALSVLEICLKVREMNGFR